MADAVNLGQIDTTNQNQQQQSQKLLGGFGDQVNNLNKNFTNAVNAQPNYLDQYNLLGKQNNLPQLQQNANTLNTAFANIPQTYTAANKGYDVNSNQLSQIIGRKAYEMTPGMTTANNALSTAQNATNQQMQYSEAQQQKELSPYQMQASMLPSLMGTQASVFTAENQNELNGLIAKIQSGVQLSEGEANRANALAVAEKQAQSAMDVTKQQQAYLPVAGYGVYNTQKNQLLGGLNGMVNGNAGKITGTY